jgi:hypothetical protein
MPLLADAHPMSINFDDMIAQSKRIVIAKYSGNDTNEFQFRLRVESVLKGGATDSIITVGRAYGKPYVRENSRFIAFINEQGLWEWVGEGDDLENGMIEMRGFYDWNAYWVSPAGITMTQLKQYLKEKKFDGTMEGDLEFPDYSLGRSEKTNTHFTIAYTYYSHEKTAHKMTVTGLPLIDFKAEPKVYIGGNTAYIEYEENMVRPLQFNGGVDSVYTGGKNFHVRFGVEEPRDLDSSQFYEYLDHPEYGLPSYELEFVLSDSTKYSFVIIPESGNREYLQYGNRLIGDQEYGQSTKDTHGGFKFGELGGETEVEIILDTLPDEKRFTDFLNDSGSLQFIPSLKTESWKGEFFARENGKMVSKGRCTVRLKKTSFTKNENYRK